VHGDLQGTRRAQAVEGHAVASDGDRKVAVRLGGGAQQRGGALTESADQGRGGAGATSRVGRGAGRARGDPVDREALVQDGEGLLSVLQEHTEVPGLARGRPRQLLRGDGVQHAIGVADRPGQQAVRLTTPWRADGSGFEVPKAAPRAVAQAIFGGVERDEEDIFPDPLAETVADAWREGAVKALEGQFAALASAVPAA
jgi:hypothetical protein